MSFSTLIKDATSFLQLLFNEPTSMALGQLFNWFIERFGYLISLKWITSLPLFPIYIPKLTADVVREGLNLTNGSEQSFEDLSFFPSSNGTWNQLLPGFWNSFFLVLPFSPARILWVRRLVIQGIPAGVSSGLGLIVGQLIFLFVAIFGFRVFMHFWCTLEPLSFLIGLVWFLIIFDQLCSKKSPTVKWEDKRIQRNLFIESFFLGCVEQTTLGQYISGLTTTAETFYNEGFSAGTSNQFIISHSTYLIGIAIGLSTFGGCLGWLLWKGSRLWYESSTLPYQMWRMQRVHPILIVIYGSTVLSSIPYYSWDYLFFKPLGFVPEDRRLNLLNSQWINNDNDPELPKWRDYYMRVSGAEPGTLGDAWLWSQYDQGEFPASRRKRALEAMLLTHEWFPPWAKSRGMLSMEYSPARIGVLKRFARNLISLPVPGGGALRDKIWPQYRRDKVIQRDAVRGVSNWGYRRDEKLLLFKNVLSQSQGTLRANLIDASRFLAFGRLRALPEIPKPEINLTKNGYYTKSLGVENDRFIKGSRKSLGTDSLKLFTAKWFQQKITKNRLKTIDNKFFVVTDKTDKYRFAKYPQVFPIYDKKDKSLNRLWLDLRLQIIREARETHEDFRKLHKYWIIRNLIKPRINSWNFRPSEENILWKELGYTNYDKPGVGSFNISSVLADRKEALSTNEANLRRMQYYLEVGDKLNKHTREQKVRKKHDLKYNGYEPKSITSAFYPLKLKPKKYNRHPRNYAAKFKRFKNQWYRRKSRFRGYDKNVVRRFIYGSRVTYGHKPHFLYTRERQIKGDRRLWRRRTPLRPAPVGPSRWSSFKYYRQKTYRQALSHVVDHVMKGQPKEYFLTVAEEKELTKRKIQLTRYYDSLRKYKKSPRFQRYVPGGSRTFTDGVYNHQFKGTLNYARRLFYVTPLEAQNMEQGRVYKMSQLLYNNNNLNPILHEELINTEKEGQPFLKLLPSPSPFYTGWDLDKHKMILTQRTLPRIDAGYRIPSDSYYLKSTSTKNSLPDINTQSLDKNNSFNFTAWPYSQNKIYELSSPRLYTRVKRGAKYRRLAFKENWRNLQLGFSWRKRPRDNYGKVKTNAIRLDTPLGYWARAKRRSLPQNKRLLRNRRLSRSLLRIPALPQLGGFSNDA